VLASLRGGVEALQAAMQRVRAEVAEPHRHIAARTRQLAALSCTVEVLHAVIRALRLVARVRESLGSDLARAAKALSELSELFAEVDMGGVAAVEAELAFVARAGAEVRAEAGAALQRGLDSLSQPDTAAALQVLANLGELPQAVERSLVLCVRRASAALAEALEPGRPGRPAPAAGGEAGLWARLDAALERVHAAALAAWHLSRVLAKKRDPSSHALFLDACQPQGGPQLTERFWAQLLAALGEQLARAQAAPGPARDQLTAGYPRLLGALDALFARLLREGESRERGVPPCVRAGEASALRRTADPFALGYLARSLQRLTDAVPPQQQQPLDPARLCARVQEELACCAQQPALCCAVAQGCTKALRLLAERCEHACAAGPEARAVGGACSPAQARTLAAAATLEAAHAALAPLLPALPDGGAAPALAAALEALHAGAGDALAPLFRGATERAEALVGGEGGAGELCRALGHFHAEFLARLPPPPPRAPAPPSRLLAAQLASRVLTLFVRHACLLRPLPEAARLRLAGETAELELALAPLAAPLEALGAPYRALRALRPLLFLETQAVAGTPLLADLPCADVLHHLLARAPLGVASPHARAGLTPAKYAAWLERAGDVEVWRGVQASLDASAGCGDDPAVLALRQLGQAIGGSAELGV